MSKEFKFLDTTGLSDDDLHLELVGKYPGNPHLGHTFEMRNAVTKKKMGQIGLKIGPLPEYIGHLSYEVLEPFRGHRYAARACRMLARFAMRHGVAELAITCLPDNAASKRTCELAGARLLGTVKVPSVGVDDYHRGIDYKIKYVLSTDG